MTLYAERKPSRHQPFAIIETRGSGYNVLWNNNPLFAIGDEITAS